jgi:hypothetical protein
VSGELSTAGFDRYPDFFRRMIVAHPFEQQMACMDLLRSGVLEKYPQLRVAFLEAGGGWKGWATSSEFLGGCCSRPAEKRMLSPISLPRVATNNSQ